MYRDLFAAVSGLLLLLIASPSTTAQSTLTLIAPTGQQPVQPGDLVVVQVHLSDLTEPTVGFQAFLEYDPARLEFVTASYTSAPFGSPIITPIESVGNEINLASGINVAGGQSPTMADAMLATLVFEAQAPNCITSLAFRSHDPPTRLSGIEGEAIEPLMLVDLPAEQPTADLNADSVVNVLDLLILLGSWGLCDPVACSADLNCDEVVDVLDLLVLLNAWG